MPRSEPIDNTADVIDSRDIIARIEDLEETRECLPTDEAESQETAQADWDASTEGEELASLRKVREQAESSPDWTYGESLIRDSYFTRYIEELISDCYEMPKELNSGDWPWRHVTVDYEAAAEEAKTDYLDIDFDGVTYWIRA